MKKEEIIDESRGDKRSLSKILNTIAEILRKRVLTPGELAQLRRLDVTSPNQPAFWRVVTTWISPEKNLSPIEEERWAMILSGMARMAPFHHAPQNSVGRILSESGFSEMRLLRLLRSEGTLFADLVRRTCTFLAAKAQPLNWTEFAALILTKDPIKAERVRRDIARDYYATQGRKESKE